VFRGFRHVNVNVMLISDVYPLEDGRTTETCSG
jgi:hypothetical protein